MTEWLLLLLVVGGVAVAIGWPLLVGGTATTNPMTEEEDADHESLAVRHRLALEAMRDVEADFRAGSLDQEGHAAQRAEAEERAASTLVALEAHRANQPALAPHAGDRRVAGLLGGILVAALLVGFALPPPIGLGERTVVNQPLADAIAQEQARQAEIQRLLERIAADARDADAFSALADAYLAGGSPDDLRRAAVALQVVIGLQPENVSAYRRLIAAYITAADWTDAGAALNAYAAFAAANEPDIPFFRGLIALRGAGDLREALRQFDRFLELAPTDPRASMIRSLRAEAAGQLE
jgi:tetratricopeptide (TPR) repeat protein